MFYKFTLSTGLEEYLVAGSSWCSSYFFMENVYKSLPHKANLFKRKVTPDALCPLCGKCPETTVHILWTCDSAKAVWTECSRRVQKLSIEAHDGFSLFSQLLDLLDDNELAEVIFIARRIWLRHNFVLFGGVLSSPAQLVQQSQASLQEFRTVEPRPEPRVLAPPREKELWKPPSVGVLKANWDASLDLQQQQMSVGAIICTESGSIVASFCATVKSISDPTVAEALAL
ncbi:hypothetical protein SLA2020_274790 [Shorea laevis]